VPRRKIDAQDIPEPADPALLARALSAAANPVFITDNSGQVVWVNAAFSERSGYSQAEAAGQTPSFLNSGSHDPSFYRGLWQTILAGQVWRGEVVEKRKDGSLYTADEIITPLKNDQGVTTHFVAIQNDITLRKQEGEREHFLAYHDALTGLYNRVLFLDLLQQAMARSARSTNPFALLYLDVDNFKQVNDTYGHHIGDCLLAAIAERLSASVRKSTDAVARLSGDEFAVLHADLSEPKAALAFARKLVESIAQPFLLEGLKVRSGISIGVAIYPENGDTPGDLLNNADKAMYFAKKRGRGNCQLYDRALCENLPTIRAGGEYSA
jgi:diguanylate cyclase (GGDEF)-like protein/PAS domain S-box-containing protein